MGFWERKREKIFAAAVILHGNQGRVAGGRCEAEPVQEEGEKERERERGKTGKEAAGRWNFGVEGECGFHIYMYVLSIFVCVCLFWRVCQPTPL